MASLSLDQSKFKQLEMTRARLSQLCSNLANLTTAIKQGNRSDANPLPDPEAVQKQVNILMRNLEAMNNVLTENHPLFSRITVHPSTNYPGRTQEATLQMLLRKKLEPELEDWVERGRAAALAAGIDASMIGGGSAIKDDANDDDDDDDDDDRFRRPGMDMDDDDDEDDRDRDLLAQRWSDMRVTLQKRWVHFSENETGEPYTEAERAMGIEKVRTGLRRDLEDSDEEDDDEEDEDEGKGGAAAAASGGGAANAQAGQMTAPKSLDPEYLLVLAARGDMDLPANLRLELQRRGR